MIGILRRLFAGTTSTEGWNLRIKRQGRGGPLIYTEGANTVVFDFELGDAGIIYCPPAGTWDRDFAWAAGRRTEIIRRVTDEFVRREFKGYSWRFETGRDDVVLIAKKT